MPSNSLIIGKPRLGWFYEGDPDTPNIAVMLRDTGDAITLTLPLQEMMSSNDPYKRWFTADVHFGDDPDRSIHSYEPPNAVTFHDSLGSVALVGCRATSSTTSLRAGHGDLVASYAIFGAGHERYNYINGFESTFPELAAWTGLKIIKHETEIDEQNRWKAFRLTAREVDETSISRRLNLNLTGTWNVEPVVNGFTMTQAAVLKSYTKTARSWNEHIELHAAVLDLVSLAAWKPLGFSRLQVSRTDDPIRNVIGESMGDAWHEVSTYRVPWNHDVSRSAHFLIPYSEVGPRGISRWIRLRRSHADAISPVIEILRSDAAWSNSSLVLAGIALEALGYLISVQKGGDGLNSRGQIGFKDALRQILNDMSTHPLRDPEEWINETYKTFISSKHPDKPRQDILFWAYPVFVDT